MGFCYKDAETSSDLLSGWGGVGVLLPRSQYQFRFFLRVSLGSCPKEIQDNADLLLGSVVGGVGVGREGLGWGGRDCPVL